MNKFTLLLILCIILVLCLIYKNPNKENFQSPTPAPTTSPTAATAPTAPTAATAPTSTSNSLQYNQHNFGDNIRLTYSLTNEIGGPVVYLYNILNFTNVFYELDYSNERTCSATSDCSTNEECLDDENNNSKCHKIIDRQAFRLVSTDQSYIELPNLEVENINVSFLFLIDDISVNQPIVSSHNNLWNMVLNNNRFKINTFDINGNVNTNDLGDININVRSKKIYDVIINIQNNELIVSINNIIKRISLQRHTCNLDSNCSNGVCVGNTNRYCDYNRENLLFGKSTNNQYMTGYIGEIQVNASNTTEDLCQFDSNVYKIKRNCLSDCKSEQGCSTTMCDEKCSSIPVCKFRSRGRHKMDCLQKCVADKECDSQHCIKMCNECDTKCPWNQTETEYDTYGSEYIDPNGKPSPLKLVLEKTSIDGTKITLGWKKPSEGKFEILGFVCYLYKTFSKGEGVKIHKITSKNCNSETEMCNYILSELKPEETYTVGIKSFNMLGLSNMSNLITFKPSVKTINKDFNIVPKISPDIIGNFNYCNVPNE